MADGRVALLDYGITGRLDEQRRLAFLRLLMGGTVNDVKLQLGALRDLGALPPSTDLDAVIRDLNLDQPVKDPTQMSARRADRRDPRAHQGAPRLRRPHAQGADAVRQGHALPRRRHGHLAPDVDLFDEITHIATYFATHHGDRIARDVGIDPGSVEIDLDGMRASMGLIADGQGSLTMKELRGAAGPHPQAHGTGRPPAALTVSRDARG